MTDKSIRGLDKQAFIHEQNKDRQTFRAQGELVHDRIYVGGLGQQIYEKDLFGFFSQFGEVSHVGIITEGDYSRGYGFVTFASKEVVRKLLDDPSDAPMVLHGRRLAIGPARQRQEHFWGRSHPPPQGQRRPKEYYSQPSDSGQEDPGKAVYDETTESATAVANDEVSLAPGDIHQSSYDILGGNNPDTYSHDALAQPLYYQDAQQPMYPQNPTMHPYPTQDPQYQYPENTLYPSFQPDDQPCYYQNYYPTPTYIYQDPTTGATFPVTSYPQLQYPAPYPATPDYTTQQPYPGTVANPSDPALYAGSYWPQSPHYYPASYNSQLNPSLIQYTYPLGDGNQHMVGHDMLVPSGHDGQNVNNEADQSNLYNNGREMGDSGFQDTMTSEQDVHDRSQDQSSSGQQVAMADGLGKDGDHYPSHYKGISPAPQQIHLSEQFSQQKFQGNTNQQQNKYTKIRSVESNKEFVKNQQRSQNGFSRPGRDSRMFPSPYKTFSPFTGNPSPRHFPLVPGPRPYYAGQGQGRGRGRIWGEQRGGGQGRIIQKKKPGKRETVEEKDVASKEVVPVGLSVNHPDILQGPMEKLDIK